MHDRKPSHTTWRTSSYSGGTGNCVEVTALTARAGVRDSMDLDAGHLTFDLGCVRDRRESRPVRPSITRAASTPTIPTNHQRGGVSITDADHTTWRKSFHSGQNGNCVEVADLTTEIGVRDSKAPDAGHLSFSPRNWTAFVTDVQGGRYDLA